MATMKTYNNTTTREDLLDIIKNIVPTPTPIITSFGSSVCSGVSYSPGATWITNPIQVYESEFGTKLYESPVSEQVKEALKGLL